jgi:hypothetical protein
MIRFLWASKENEQKTFAGSAEPVWALVEVDGLAKI